ncbi:hypothetical protein FRX31_003696 [Thalictrum thalictroides]|uniref:Uncharacterized protein n=1 Tax=Thalictrum thalictroides TaxID=46969 RepID=A0A7J6XCK6_THATH|nr:hypothetical protein FRX31_003696 [Thalictrum thalictroides]
MDAMLNLLQIDPTTEKPIGIIEMYRQTHFSDKRGCWIDEESRQRYEAMINLQSDPTTLTDGVDLSEMAIFRKVLGVRLNYIRGLGHGMMPVQSSSSFNNNHPAVEEFRNSTAKAIRRAEEAERCAEVAERHAETGERRADDQEQRMETMQTQIAFLMTQLGGNTT